MVDINLEQVVMSSGKSTGTMMIRRKDVESRKVNGECWLSRAKGFDDSLANEAEKVRMRSQS